jgi:hypothetical protein
VQDVEAGGAPGRRDGGGAAAAGSVATTLVTDPKIRAIPPRTPATSLT